MKKFTYSFLTIVMSLIIILVQSPMSLLLAEQNNPYFEYINRLENIKIYKDLKKNGFKIAKEQVFIVEFENFGEVNLVPTIDKRYGRVVLFLFDLTGNLLYKTDQLDNNYRNKGEINQPNREITAISFRDMNNDGLSDITIISRCNNESGIYSEKFFKIGEVLFQSQDGFYRDWRISDRINRFSMNNNIEMISSFVRDGLSLEFLYTSSTLDELIQNGFQIINNHSFSTTLEKYGEVMVRPGVYKMAGQYIFMVYLINTDGKIVSDFQPMNDYYSFIELKQLYLADVNGNGERDMVIIASYSKWEDNGIEISEESENIYYQRAGYFY